MKLEFDMSRFYTEETLMEISKIAVNVTRYPNTDDVLEMCWIEDMPAPYDDNNVEIEIDKEKAIELIEVLNSHFGFEDEQQET